MRSFQVYLEQMASSSIAIDMEHYKQFVVDGVADIAWRHNEYQDSIKNFKLDTDKVGQALKQINTDAARQILDALNGGDKETISDLLSDLLGARKPEHFDQIRYVFSSLRNYLDQHNPRYWSEDEEKELVEQLVQTTYKNMTMIASKIKEAISRMKEWGNWSLTITPSFDNNDLTGAVESAYVQFNVPTKPGFSYLMGEIDDVLDGGDTEFFTNHHLEMDYFALVAELRKPGSSSKGSVITVYTARPVRDRATYLNTKVVPANIYVTTSPNRAMALSQDLAYGSETEVRDVYKIRVDSRYLALQYDAGTFKDFQLVSRTGQVPVLSISQY